MRLASEKNRVMKTSKTNHPFFSPIQEPGTFFIQSKLKVGPANDAYEREADSVAERIMRQEEDEEEEPVQTKTSMSSIQTVCPECEEDENVQPKKAGRTLITKDTPSAFHEALQSEGETLSKDTRSFMETRMDYDFSDVRIHTGSLAAKSAQSINALAYTTGNSIVFNKGQYAPNTKTGKRLLAHELTHVVQQAGTSGPIVQRFPTGPQFLGGYLDEPISLVTPDIGIIPDILDGITIAVGLSLGRSLSPAERGILQPVFGPHLNYSLIRICSNTICSPDGVARTIGNLIATPPQGISNSTLVHEVAHVWQHQNGIRYSYITSSLLSQFGAWLLTGSRSAAYNWQMYYNNSIPWMAWNAEAQAEYIEAHSALPPWYVWGTGGFLPVP